MNEIYIFSLFILTGMIIGILFDIFRIFRKNFKTIDSITYIQDFLFWILTGIILLYSIFAFNNGELRGYIFVGIILGIFLYMLILSKLFIKIFSKIISLMKKILSVPINFLNKCVIKPLSNLLSRLLNWIKKIIKVNIPKINLKNKKNDKLSNKIQ